MALIDKSKLQGIVGNSSSQSAGGFMSMLFELRNNAHIAHLQTNSFAAHKALNELYDGIVDAADAYAEAYQSQFGIITGYTCGTIMENCDCVSYINQCITKTNAYRATVSEGYLQQLIDNILELLHTTIYKLKFLK